MRRMRGVRGVRRIGGRWASRWRGHQVRRHSRHIRHIGYSDWRRNHLVSNISVRKGRFNSGRGSRGTRGSRGCMDGGSDGGVG